MSVEEDKALSASPFYPRVRELYRRFERLVRYVIVGGGAATLYAVLVYMLLQHRIVNDAVLASALASLLSQPVAFVVHRAVTYRDTVGGSDAPFRYAFLVVSTFLISTGSMYLVTRAGWSYWFAIATCWFLVPTANFLIGSLWVFRTKSIFRYQTERSSVADERGQLKEMAKASEDARNLRKSD